MEMKCEEVKSKIEDGSYQGIIVDVQYREQPFNYTDVVIEFDGGKRIKYGVPSKLTKESKLGRLLELFGTPIQVDGLYNPKTLLVGKKVAFMTLNKVTPRGTFANIVKDSLRYVQ